MSNVTISIDYDNCMEQARRLDQFADECDRQAESAVNTSGDIADRWKGNSGIAMSEKYKTWSSDQRAIAEEMHAVAAEIRNTAQAIKDADEAAAARIQAEQMMGAVSGAAAVGGAAIAGAAQSAFDTGSSWLAKAGRFLKGR